jgi:hypothetical protein
LGANETVVKAACIFLLSLGLAACSGKPYSVEPADGSVAVRANRLFVASHGWHTGIILPASQLNALVPELASRFGNVAYYGNLRKANERERGGPNNVYGLLEMLPR